MNACGKSKPGTRDKTDRKRPARDNCVELQDSTVGSSWYLTLDHKLFQSLSLSPPCSLTIKKYIIIPLKNPSEVARGETITY